MKSRKLSTVYPKMATGLMINTLFQKWKTNKTLAIFFFYQTNSTHLVKLILVDVAVENDDPIIVFSILFQNCYYFPRVSRLIFG